MTVTFLTPPGRLADTLTPIVFTVTQGVLAVSAEFRFEEGNGLWETIYQDGRFSYAYSGSTIDGATWTVRRSTPWPADLRVLVDEAVAGDGAVASVFGRVGAVVAMLGDYTSSLVSNVSGVVGTTVSAALDTLASGLGVVEDLVDALGLTKADKTTSVLGGAGLTGGGDLSADRTLAVGAHADGSIAVSTDAVQVGVLATDAQHGARGGGALHEPATSSAAGFMTTAQVDALAQAQVDIDALEVLAGKLQYAWVVDHYDDLATVTPVPGPGDEGKLAFVRYGGTDYFGNTILDNSTFYYVEEVSEPTAGHLWRNMTTADVEARVTALEEGGSGGGGGAPVDASYLTLAANATLTAERVLTQGAGISIVDGGAGGAVTVTNKNLWVNQPSSSYTVLASDLGKISYANLISASTYTVPPGLGSAAGGEYFGIFQSQAGNTQVSIIGGSGVTITTPIGRNAKTRSQGALVFVRCLGANSWAVEGDLEETTSYVTLAASPTLLNERVLTQGAGISIIDGGAGGAVTVAASTPYRASISANSTTIPPAAWTPITNSVKIFDNNNNYSADRYTVPVTGIYWVRGMVEFNSLVTPAIARGRVTRDGTEVMRGGAAGSGSSGFGSFSDFSSIIQATAGNVLRLEAYHNDSVSRNLYDAYFSVIFCSL